MDSQIQPSKDFMCPIGLDIMEDPVMTCDGHTFDKKNIKDWFGRGNKTNPMTGAKLKNLDLIPNISLKNIISDFLGGIKKQKQQKFKKELEQKAPKRSNKFEKQTQIHEIQIFKDQMIAWKIQFQDRRVGLNKSQIKQDDGVYYGIKPDGKKNGYGIKKYNNKTVEEGEFKKDKLNGKGVKYFPTGNKYEGEFKDGLFEGYGIYFYKTGTIYEGSFKNNFFQGKGRRIYPNGDAEIGIFKNDKLNGHGEKFLSNGKIYRGDFVNDAFSGSGKYIFTNGTIYEGKFYKNAFEGMGKKIYPNGDYYEGAFRADKEHGKGTMHFKKNKKSESQEYEFGKLIK